MSTLIFGGGGFVGLTIAERLLKAGERVTIADRTAPPGAALEALGRLGPVSTVLGDVRDAAFVNAAMATKPRWTPPSPRSRPAMAQGALPVLPCDRHGAHQRMSTGAPDIASGKGTPAMVVCQGRFRSAWVSAMRGLRGHLEACLV